MNSYNPYSLEGKTIFITGASSGIGRCTAIECSRLGARLFLTGRNEARLSETFNELQGDGHSLCVADLTRGEDVEALVQAMPKIDGFVCNAGINFRNPVNFVKEDDLRRTFDTNIVSSILLTKAIMKGKKMNRGGSMVFVSSMGARQEIPGNSVYAASKAAVESFSRSCALEFASKGIRSNAVLPGMIETPLTTDGRFTSEELERDKSYYMLKRYGKPEEVAWAIAYLLSDASAWVTNTSLVVAGGGRVVH